MRQTKPQGVFYWVLLLGITCNLSCGGESDPSGVKRSDPEYVDHVTLTQDGHAVIERAITSLGGRVALERIHNRTMKGSLAVTPLDVTGRFEIVQARPNKVYMKIETQGLGKIERGCDGSVFWEKHTPGELRFFEGEELQLHLLTAHFDETTYDQAYKAIEPMGVEAVNDVNCYKVLLVPQQGPSIINFYSQESGLHLKTLLRVTRAGFGLTMETYSLDYRKTEGIQVAYTILEKSMGTETQRTLTELAFNTELPEGIFDPPSDPNE